MVLLRYACEFFNAPSILARELPPFTSQFTNCNSQLRFKCSIAVKMAGYFYILIWPFLSLRLPLHLLFSWKIKQEILQKMVHKPTLIHINELNWSLRFTQCSPQAQHFCRLHGITYLSPILFQTPRHLSCAPGQLNARSIPPSSHCNRDDVG